MPSSKSHGFPFGVGLLLGIGAQCVPTAWNPFVLYVAVPCFFWTSLLWTVVAMHRNPRALFPGAGIPWGLALGYAVAWAAGTVWRALA